MESENLSAKTVAKFVFAFIIVALIVASLLSCNAKKKTSTKSEYISLFHNSSSTAAKFIAPNFNWQVLQPIATTWTDLMLIIDHPKGGYPTDSLIMHVKKSQITWLNDSTAVIHKRK